MKKLLLIWVFSGSLDSFSQDLPRNKPPKIDTVCEWMHVSTKRFVMIRKAIAIRENGYCIQHLQCDGKPFKPSIIIGWCQGKGELLEKLINERREK